MSDDELVIARNELDDVNDRLFELAGLVRDAQVQLDDGMDEAAVLRRLLDRVDGVIGTN